MGLRDKGESPKKMPMDQKPSPSGRKPRAAPSTEAEGEESGRGKGGGESGEEGR